MRLDGPVSWFGTSTDVTSRPIGMMATAYSWTEMEHILKRIPEEQRILSTASLPAQLQTGKIRFFLARRRTTAAENLSSKPA